MNWNRVLHFATNGNPEPDVRVHKTEEEWAQMLDPETFRITRRKGTERAGTGALCYIFKPGIYQCVCCGASLFDSSIKFDSGTGWPSFTQPIKENAIRYEKDVSFGMIRVEVMCNACEAHLGHVFPDGPPPGGLRYCINSASLVMKDN
ncbi:MAG: peptide-methionine (R)-S-oxide reductase MsrB [Cytophagaceae bacterium]|jgi:peptide-methionine (R)-S-oxide reductase|nr:peptide-methionine (R)-S-oxide reductase MsrB [Cytophagaceae bacterium]